MMKVCISSYERDGRKSLTLYKVNMFSKKVSEVASLALTEPSFCISYKDIIFTYTKEPLRFLMIKLEKDILTIIDSIDVPLETMTHLYYDEKHHRLYGASYKDGSILRVDIKNNKFEDLHVIHIGGLCHYIQMDKNHEYVYEVNIQMDEIHKYDKDLNPIDKYVLPKGIGPRHMNIKGDDIYFITEYSNEVYHLNIVSRRYECVGSLDPSFKDTSYGATILLDSKYMYVSNRGEETIASFDYNLKFVKRMSVYGANSRHMIFANKKAIVTLNKDSNNVVFIDKTNGKKLLEFSYNQPSCACVLH